MDNFDLKKYLAENKLYETISLDIEDDIAILSGDSGEYEGEIKDGKASFSVMYDDLDYRISDQYNESNIEDFLGKNHAFVEASKKYNHNWDIERDLVGITIQLKESNESLSVGSLFEEEGQFDSDIQNNTNKNDFFFWYRGGKRGEKQALQAKELLQQNGIDADYSLGPYYIDFSKAGVEQRVAHQILRDAGLTNFIIGNTNDMTIN